MIPDFLALLVWSLYSAKSNPTDQLASDVTDELPPPGKPVGKSVLLLVADFVVLLFSSRLLVWGAVAMAKAFGVSDLMIGLTIVAVGTSLPELTSAIIAAKIYRWEGWLLVIAYLLYTAFLIYTA